MNLHLKLMRVKCPVGRRFHAAFDPLRRFRIGAEDHLCTVKTETLIFSRLHRHTELPDFAAVCRQVNLLHISARFPLCIFHCRLSADRRHAQF